MWKRILTLVVVLIVIALSVFLWGRSAIEAGDTEEIHTTEVIAVESEKQELISQTIETTEATEDIERIETIETEPVYIEKFTEVPHYFQTDYPNTPYGVYGDTVATDGCGIASLAMVLSYLLDEEILPDELAEKYAMYCTGHGSSWNLLPDSAEDYGVTIEEQTSKWPNVVEALKNGRVVIANVGVSVFSPGGHFIVLDGISEDGRIFVKDPYKGNYAESSSDILKDGFANGFDQEHIASHSYCWWVYASKNVVKSNITQIN